VVSSTDLLAVAGFGLVVLLSIFPWTKFGDTSGFFQAWTLHWSLVAVGAALVGLIAGISARRRPHDARLEASLQIGLGLLVALGAYLHYHRPPPLSAPSPVPVIAIMAAALAVASGIWKALSASRLGRRSALV
jgi:hypothetical protein